MHLSKGSENDKEQVFIINSNLSESQSLNSIYGAFEDSDAVLILTEWNVYKQIDWLKASKLMRRPAWLFDARSIINPKSLEGIPINFWRIGDGNIYYSI